MGHEKFLVLFCCLASVLVAEGDVPQSSSKQVDSPETSWKQLLEGKLIYSGTIDVRPGPRCFMYNGVLYTDEVVYPIEESNFEEVFGKIP